MSLGWGLFLQQVQVDVAPAVVGLLGANGWGRQDEEHRR